MIRQEFFVNDWYIIAFYCINKVPADEILGELEDIGCNNIDDSVFVGKNWGFTYSNLNKKVSIIVIGPTTSAEEFQNTWDHEKEHLTMHIAEKENLDVTGESYAYLRGAIGMKMFEIAQMFLCNMCRKIKLGI